MNRTETGQRLSSATEVREHFFNNGLVANSFRKSGTLPYSREVFTLPFTTQLVPTLIL